MRSSLLTSRLGQALAAALLLVALSTAVGLVLLWPDGRSSARLASPLRPKTQSAEVTLVRSASCPTSAAGPCLHVEIRLLSGPDAGRSASFGAGQDGPIPAIDVGDRLRVVRNEVPEGADPGLVEPYALADFERRMPMGVLLLAFATLVLLLARRQGARSLVGLGLSLAVVVFFVVPAILDGRSPLAVALVGSLAIMLVTLGLTHGLGPKSVAAALGTATSLMLTAGLAVVFTELTHLTGFSSEEATLLGASAGDVSLAGLVLAGMVIGALGVLDDVTVSQASTVMALRRANPAQGLGQLYTGALAVGRDHVSATVNTLVLAYVGAALPILLVFSVGDTGFVEAVNREAVAEQITATLVGSIGLIAAVPVTTALGALLASRLPPDALDGHAH